MQDVESKYQSVPFWSWNGELEESELIRQIEWMKAQGVGGFFMHARSGLTTEYLSEKWFSCVEACCKRAEELGMNAWAYDENGWPSGFAGGKLLDSPDNLDQYLLYSFGLFDPAATVSYDVSGGRMKRATKGDTCLNVFIKRSATTVDITNPEVVEQFLQHTHKLYQNNNKDGIKGFFTDEPQLYRWHTPYSGTIADHFASVYHEDILDGLGLLFVEGTNYRRFRYRYYKSLQTLMLKNFAQKIYEWCDSRGYRLTGHFWEESNLAEQIMGCCGIMPFYEYQHIPGIDWLGKGTDAYLAPKQAASVAAQLGKEQVLSETFGCCGWDVTPMELKKIAEFQYVNGVNLICHHLIPYSEQGHRKRDYPAHYSDVNPWVKKNFKQFNDYFSVLSKILAQSTEVVEVAVLHPLRSAYLDFKHDEPSGNVGGLDTSLKALSKRLSDNQIPYHYLDETLLAKYGSVENGVLICGKCAYKYLILPDLESVDKTTEVLLRQFVLSGGKLLISGTTPSLVEGEDFDFDYLKSNITFAKIKSCNEFFEAEPHAHICTTLRRDNTGRLFLYAVNTGGETSYTFRLKQHTGFLGYDILLDRFTQLPHTLHFSEAQSYILYLTDKPAAESLSSPERLKLKNSFTVMDKTENFLPLDFVRYSFDGINYSKKMYHLKALQKLLQARYNGQLYLKYEFEQKSYDGAMALNIEKGLYTVRINGRAVTKRAASPLGKEYDSYPVSRFIRLGNNEIVIQSHYQQSDRVYEVLFGENVTEGLINCLNYDSSIEMVILSGTFGVYGKLEKSKDSRALLGKDFYIGCQKTEITDLVADGFPFFRGDIRLIQEVEANHLNYVLILKNDFQLAEVFVNRINAGIMMLSNRLELASFLKHGKNLIEIVFTVGNRNLLGPFHNSETKTEFVSPETFSEEEFPHTYTLIQPFGL